MILYLLCYQRPRMDGGMKLLLQPSMEGAKDTAVCELLFLLRKWCNTLRGVLSPFRRDERKTQQKSILRTEAGEVKGTLCLIMAHFRQLRVGTVILSSSVEEAKNLVISPAF
jgi:hypothetical protein